MSDVFEFVRTKRAIRQFTDDPLPEDVMQQIVEAGRLSGSAKNRQPWHFVVITERHTLQALSECGAFAGHLAGAAMGIALVTQDPYERLTTPFDLGRATQNMMLTAWAEGVGSVMATIYEAPKAGDILGIPPEYTVCWCISFGYPAVETERPPRKGGRKEADEVVHWGQW